MWGWVKTSGWANCIWWHAGCILQILRAIDFDSGCAGMRGFAQPKGAIDPKYQDRPENPKSADSGREMLLFGINGGCHEGAFCPESHICAHTGVFQE
jgi:hypothetical protein